MAVEGAEVTLCAAPVRWFVLVDGVCQEDTDVPWCWVCHATASEESSAESFTFMGLSP